MRQGGQQQAIEHLTTERLFVVMTESRFPHKFLRQMIFYRKHDQQKDYDKDNKPTASFHEKPPFSISSCKARIVRKSSSVASKFP